MKRVQTAVRVFEQCEVHARVERGKLLQRACDVEDCNAILVADCSSEDRVFSVKNACS